MNLMSTERRRVRPGAAQGRVDRSLEHPPDAFGVAGFAGPWAGPVRRPDMFVPSLLKAVFPGRNTAFDASSLAS